MLIRSKERLLIPWSIPLHLRDEIIIKAKEEFIRCSAVIALNIPQMLIMHVCYSLSLAAHSLLLGN